MPFDHEAWLKTIDDAVASLGGYVNRVCLPEGVVLLIPDRGAPAFQFNKAGRLIDVVHHVNTLMGADTDPYGVADWWLLPHSYLQGNGGPATLVGKDDKLLLDLARAAGED